MSSSSAIVPVSRGPLIRRTWPLPPALSASKKQKPATTEAAPKTFASPDDASKAPVDAAKSQNQDDLIAIMGPASSDIVFSGDATEDKAARDGFAQAYQVMNRWRSCPTQPSPPRRRRQPGLPRPSAQKSLRPVVVLRRPRRKKRFTFAASATTRSPPSTSAAPSPDPASVLRRKT
jgi:hypothetical protein